MSKREGMAISNHYECLKYSLTDIKDEVQCLKDIKERLAEKLNQLESQ